MTSDCRHVAGFDEVGRGCIAGPVIAAAVILDDKEIPGLTDSKRLTAGKRLLLAEIIRNQATAWAIGRAEVSEIDEHNILQASLLAMQRAYAGLSLRPEVALIDGNRCPLLPITSYAIVGGDATVPSISAASVLAKVARDDEMSVMNALYPGYGFATHKGYPTKHHKNALHTYGITPLHRRSYAPVAAIVSHYG